MEDELYEKFQRSLDYALENNPVEIVAKDLIVAAREGWATMKKVDAPYIQMTEPSKTIKYGE